MGNDVEWQGRGVQLWLAKVWSGEWWFPYAHVEGFVCPSGILRCLDGRACHVDRGGALERKTA